MNSYLELWHNQETSWLKPCNFENEVDSNKVVVQAMHSLISQGTERLVTSSLLTAEVSENMMVPYMKGKFSGKFTYGYSLVGKVLNGPANLMDSYVHLLHPHQEMAIVLASDVSIIPDDIPPKVACLASNMETAVNAIWDAKIDIGDRVLIVGYGIIGALIAFLLMQYPGVELLIQEINKERAALARSQGFSVVRSNAKVDQNFDIVFNASGDEAGLQVAINSTITEGKIIELSWYGSMPISLHLGGSFHYGRKRIISSQVSKIPAHKKHNWTVDKRKILVFDLLRHPGLINLITDEIEFSETPAYYAKLRKREIHHFSTLINYHS